MGLILKQGDVLFLDTSPFIYFFEKHADWFPPIAGLFEQIYATDTQVITSIITYIELTTQPARQGEHNLVRKYRDYLTHGENITIFPLDLTIADEVVRLRAKYQLKTPDAVQLGTAVASGADYVITDDREWRRVTEVKVLLMNNLL